MSAFKQLLASDVIITPFEVHKGFTFQGNELTGSNVGIERLLGKNKKNSLFNTLSDPTTGQISTQYQRLVYNSVKQLYYTNYLSSSFGDIVNRPVLIPGSDTEGDRLIGSSSNPAYDNYLQTTLSYPKYFPTSSNSIIGVISIPVRLFGDYIQPYSFILSNDTGSLVDDGDGNIFYSSSILNINSSLVGNIFYPHGIIILTGNPNLIVGSSSFYGFAIYGTSSYGATSTFDDELFALITDSNINISFSSSYKIYETQYKCTIRESEFNATLNPSTLSGSDGIPFGYVTESYFNPYITTVGLYDEQQNLLAIGKLAQPLPSSPTTDTTILINIDR